MFHARHCGSTVILLALVTGCTAVKEQDFDRQAMLVSLADSVVVPGLENAAAAAADLQTASASLCTNFTAVNLAAAQLAWRNAQHAWAQTAPYRFGPMEDLNTAPNVDDWPTSATGIEALVQGSEPLTTEGFDMVGTNKKGLPAVEYLLFVPQGGLSIVEGFTAVPRRCQALAGMSGNLAARLQAVVTAWQTAFRQTFTHPEADNPSYPTLKAAVDQVVNQQVSMVESIANLRLATPLGLRTGGTPLPEQVENPHAQTAVDTMRAMFEGLQALYCGCSADAGAPSLSAFVQSRNAPLNDQMNADMEEIMAMLAAQTAPLATAVVDANSGVDALYQRVRAHKRLWGTEVVATLGVTLTFNDNDGD